MNSRAKDRVVANVDAGWMDIQIHAKTAENWLSINPLMMLYICTKFCESISNGFRVTDLNSRVNTMVAANVDAGQTDGQTDIQTHAQMDGKPDPYIASCLRQARQQNWSFQVLNVVFLCTNLFI